MYCSKCGNKMQAGEMFCGNCGTPRKGLVTEPAAPVQVNPVTAEVAASTDTNKEPAQTTPATAATPSPATPAAKKKPPKKALIIIPVLLALIAIGIFVYLHFFTYRSVKIEEYNGNVELERNGSEKDLFEGLKLIPKDTVTTGEDGLIELFIDSDKHVIAEAYTCFSVNAVGNENSGKVTIDLEYGSTLITIDEKLAEDSEFEVQTPNVFCSVRGTTFEVEYDKQSHTSEVAVTEGVVNLKTENEELELTAGQKAVVTDDSIETYLLFGKYEQDGNTANGAEPIEWMVLSENENGTLLISRNVLDAKPYNDVQTGVPQVGRIQETEEEWENNNDADVTWETSTLRQWLNEDFYEEAFTTEEQSKLITATLENPDNAAWGTAGGNDTEDKVFLLDVEQLLGMYPFDSWDEKSMTGSSTAIVAAPTAYAKAQGVELSSEQAASWWLRSPGSGGNWVCMVYGEGIAGWGYEEYMSYEMGGIRPVIYMDPEYAKLPSAGNLTQEETVIPASGKEPATDPEEDSFPYSYSEDGYIIFGNYEQDNDLTNGPEPIEWEVLGSDDNGTLLISRYVLDAQPYGTEDTGVTWENSTLRQWLNDDFYNTAFSDAEKEWILTTTVRTGDNEIYGTSGGNDTQDRVFCLSTEEIREHFDLTTWISEDEYQREEYWANPTLIGMVTPYAVDRGALAQTITQEHYDEYLENHGYNEDVIGLKCSYWWLRSPGTENGSNLYVGYSGMTNWKVNITSSAREDGGVRPALYITQ